MEMEFFAKSLAEICNHSLIPAGKKLRWAVITNPRAGGFAIPSRWKKNRKILEEIRLTAHLNPEHEDFDTAAVVSEYTHEPVLAA